jgi:hypothetical protein
MIRRMIFQCCRPALRQDSISDFVAKMEFEDLQGNTPAVKHSKVNNKSFQKVVGLQDNNIFMFSVVKYSKVSTANTKNYQYAYAAKYGGHYILIHELLTFQHWTLLSQLFVLLIYLIQ